MATPKNQMPTDSKPAKSSGRRRALKTAAVVAAVGLATLAVAKGLKTSRGRALKKKVMSKGRKVVRKAKRMASPSIKRAARKTASRAR